MKIPFTKMHGIGNDFIVVDNMSGRLRLESRQVRRLADRRRGIGCDQLLVAEPAGESGADARMRIYNSDGSEVGQCGNGVRCVAVFLRDKGIVRADEIVIEAGTRRVHARILDRDMVTVDMGTPRFPQDDVSLETGI